MRKFSQMILTLLFAIPMLFGGLSTLGVFSNTSKTASNGLNTLLATSNGGGGGRLLKGWR